MQVLLICSQAYILILIFNCVLFLILRRQYLQKDNSRAIRHKQSLLKKYFLVSSEQTN